MKIKFGVLLGSMIGVVVGQEIFMGGTNLISFIFVSILGYFVGLLLLSLIYEDD